MSTATSTAYSKTIDFSLTGLDPEFSFVLDSAPNVDSYKLGHYFSLSQHKFFSATKNREGGGFDNYFGEQLYGGSENAPTFKPGVFYLLNGDTGNTDKLTISWDTGGSLPPPVPESSTWAMMLVGFAGFGLSAYRRKKSRPTPPERSDVEALTSH